jgi:hypothetical protein
MQNKVPIAIGVSAGIALMTVAFVLAGAGHGTLWGLILFFAPITLLQPLTTLSPSMSIFITITIFIGGPLLYGVYAAFLGSIRSIVIARRRRLFTAILAVHYACFVLAAIVIREELHYFERMWGLVPWLIISAVLVFIALQVIAVYWVMRPKGSGGD